MNKLEIPIGNVNQIRGSRADEKILIKRISRASIISIRNYFHN